MDVKRGSTFLLGLQVKVKGAPQDLTGWTIESGIGMRNKSFYRPITVTILDAAAGKVKLSAATADWPLGQMFFDIRYTTASGQVIVSSMVEVQVTPSITQ